MTQGDTSRLRQSVESAIDRSRASRDASEVLPLLHRLARRARCGSDEFVFAHRKLAELLSERAPWRASLHAKRVLACAPDDSGAWATLALCQTFLGHFRYAKLAYASALERAPDNPWYAHNLGHLMDVALDDAEGALPFLELAYAQTGGHPDVCASYAHALGCAGRISDARAILEAFPGRPRPKELTLLLRWLDAGARGSALSRPREPLKGPLLAPRDRTPKGRGLRVRLAKGLEHLPFDASQRARAGAVAKDVLARGDHPRLGSLSQPSLAAAIAYAIVFVDEVPLSVGEVAAPFRVGVAQLRGAFAALRAELDLTRGDARYGGAQRPR